MTMRAATLPLQRPHDARLLVIDSRGHIEHRPRSAFVELAAPRRLRHSERCGHPARQPARHPSTQRRADRNPPCGTRVARSQDVKRFTAVVFGAGDFRTPTEARPPRLPLASGDRLTLGTSSATIVRLLDHPRLVELQFDGDATAHLARAGATGQAGSVRPSARAARLVGRMDANRRATGGVRTAVGGLRARLAQRRCTACSRDCALRR